MKIIALLLNFALLMFGGWQLVEQWGRIDSDDVLIFSLIIGAPVTSVWAFWRESDSSTWFSLWVKRKKMEENIRIKKLSSQDK